MKTKIQAALFLRMSFLGVMLSFGANAQPAKAVKGPVVEAIEKGVKDLGNGTKKICDGMKCWIEEIQGKKPGAVKGGSNSGLLDEVHAPSMREGGSVMSGEQRAAEAAKFNDVSGAGIKANDNVLTFGTNLPLANATKPELLKATGAAKLKEVVPTTETKGLSLFDKFMAKLGMNSKLAKEQAIAAGKKGKDVPDMKVFTADDIKVSKDPGNIDGKAFVADDAMVFDKEAKKAMEDKAFVFDSKGNVLREGTAAEKEKGIAKLAKSDSEKDAAVQYEMNLICASCPGACPRATKGVKGELLTPIKSH